MELGAAEDGEATTVPLVRAVWAETPYYWPPVVLDLLSSTAVDNDAVAAVVAVR